MIILQIRSLQDYCGKVWTTVNFPAPNNIVFLVLIIKMLTYTRTSTMGIFIMIWLGDIFILWTGTQNLSNDKNNDIGGNKKLFTKFRLKLFGRNKKMCNMAEVAWCYFCLLIQIMICGYPTTFHTEKTLCMWKLNNFIKSWKEMLTSSIHGLHSRYNKNLYFQIKKNLC